MPMALWIRVTALVCVFFTLGLVVPQACHTHLHFESRPRHAAVQASDAVDETGLEASCSLCVALQTGVPVAAARLSRVVMCASGVSAPRAAVLFVRELAFSLQSRPPPVALSA